MASVANAAGGILASTRKSIDALLGDVGGLLADLTSQEHSTAASDGDENEEARRVIDVELQRFWQGYYELKRRHDENALSVAVLALTKSGKSTLLNALMGMEVLPMNNVPETARICKITHDAAAREPLLRDAAGKVLSRGEAAVRSRLQQLNSAARTSSGPLSPQSSGSLAAAGASSAADAAGGELGAGGSSGGVCSASSVLHISAPLVALEGFGPEFGRVTLLDTPGPNEAGEEQLKHQVERLLEGVDCVLYLLDYTKLKTAEEEGLFRRLRAINPQLVSRLSSRLFFVINKVDASETSEGLDPDEVRNYVADLVTRQLGGAATPAPPPGLAGAGSGSLTSGSQSAGGAQPTQPGTPPRGAAAATAAAAPGSPSGSVTSGGGSGGGSATAALPPFRLHPEQVLLLSARNALMARLVLGGRASQDALKRFQRLAFGAFGSFGGRGAAAGPHTEQLRAAAGCLLEGSGVLDLEGRVLAFLVAHAGSVKLLATADDLTRLLAQVRNVALACRSCLHRNVAALQEEAEGLRGELEEATAAFEAVRSRTNAVRAEVVAEIKAHLNTLRRRLFTHIVQTLDTDSRAPPPQAAVPGSSSGPAGRWARVRDKFLSMFTSSSGLPPQQGPHTAGPSLVSEARTRSREELQALLLDLHDDLMGQIHSEVYDFWGVLEACAASRHAELMGALNEHLAALSRRVEGAVSEALGVQLTPADIRLRPPSAEQLHSDVQDLIEKGIRESTEKHIRVGARTSTERVFRQPQGPPSLCRWGGYWVDVPRTRTVVETYTATVYSLRPEEIANHFIGLVDGAVTASERALGSYVEALVERQLAAAKERIRDYGDRYLSVMSAALAASSRGAECRSSALAAVEGYLARLDELLLRAQAAQRDAEAAVPGGAAGLMDEVEVYDDEDDDDDGVYGPPYGPDDEQQQEAADEGDEQQERVQEGAGLEGGGMAAEGASALPPAADGDGRTLEAAAAEQLEDAFLAAAYDGAAEEVTEGSAAAVAVLAATLLSGASSSSIPDIDAAAIEVADADTAADVAAAVVVAGGNVPEDPVLGGETLSAGCSSSSSSSVAVRARGSCTAAASEAGLVGGGEVTPGTHWLGGDVGAAALSQDEMHRQQQQQQMGQQLLPEQLDGASADRPVGDALEAIPPPPPQPVVGVRGAGGPAGQDGSSALMSGSSVCASASYSAMPFDYSRAFLEAMSSSEMGSGTRMDEPLTMIPLTAEGEGGYLLGGRRGEAAPGAGSHGADSPRSGASEDWQLVGGDEALEAAGEAGGKE